MQLHVTFEKKGKKCTKYLQDCVVNERAQGPFRQVPQLLLHLPVMNTMEGEIKTIYTAVWANLLPGSLDCESATSKSQLPVA